VKWSMNHIGRPAVVARHHGSGSVLTLAKLQIGIVKG